MNSHVHPKTIKFTTVTLQNHGEILQRMNIQTNKNRPGKRMQDLSEVPTGCEGLTLDGGLISPTC